jgi:O-antigen/teichoic acid export membrane protein
MRPQTGGEGPEASVRQRSDTSVAAERRPHTTVGSYECRGKAVRADAREVTPQTAKNETLREKQEAGLAALIALAVAGASTGSMSVVGVSFPFPAVGTEKARDVDGTAAPSTTDDAELGRWSKLRARLLTDHLVRNSLYLIVSYGIQAAFGAALWIMAAHLFSPRDVGEASSLFAATALIAQLSLMGLSTTLVRYLPTASNRDALITAAFLFVAALSTMIGAVYLILIPIIAPSLAFMVRGPWLVVGFLFLTAGMAVNLLTDSVFIASRKASYAALTDGVVGGVMRLGLVLGLAGTGAYGLYSSNAGGFVTSALASIGLMMIVLRWRPRVTNPLATVRPLLRFSVPNYLGELFYQAPTVAVPIIVLDRLGASSAAYYYIAFQLAALVHATGHSIGASILAEGSQAGANMRALLRASRRVMIWITIPATVLLVIAAHWILTIFGSRYSEHGTLTLILLTLAAIPIAANNWLSNILRLFGRLRSVVVGTGVYGLAICSLAWFLAPHGLSALAASWVIGGMLAAGFTALPVARTLHRERLALRGRHRRTPRWVTSMVK